LSEANIDLTPRKVNPLCTYINHTTPSWTSPGPLAAAAAPLTIPVQLTLSEFKLSGFVILVFSKEKGVTLVFRNDPLESMRVQSSFDSIPFIKNYLQKEIERQVRGLFQEELPLAVYKLSLRLLEVEDRGSSKPKDSIEHQQVEQEDADDIAPLYADPSEAPPFPEKNALRLQALRNSQQTLSLFTPWIQGAVYRATPPSSLGKANPADTPHADASLRPGLHSSNSTMSLGNGHGRRKRKRRIVNLRKGWETTSTPISEPVSTASSEHGRDATVASAPEYGTEVPSPRKLPVPITSTPPPVEEAPLPTLPSSWRPKPDTLRTYGAPHPPPSRIGRATAAGYPSGIVEKAFMMRFMAEMSRQAEERRDEIAWESRFR
jgi:distribution and morphology protein 34